MVNIYPKLATNCTYGLEAYNSFSGLELQMMSTDYGAELLRIKEFLRALPNLRQLCLHMPYPLANLGILLLEPHLRDAFLAFLVTCSGLATRHGVSINVVVHCTLSVAEFNTVEGYANLRALERFLEGSNVGILIENSLVDLNESSATTIYDAIFDPCVWKHIHFCLDVCHLQASENATGQDILLSRGVLASTTHVHFSCTRAEDGYRDKENTHSRAHESLDELLPDLYYLRSKGLDIYALTYIAEINESDTFVRPLLQRELKLLQEAFTRRL